MLTASGKRRVAVLVSGGGTNLQAILDARGSVIRHAEVVLVVSNNPAAFALQRAQRAGIPTVVLTCRDPGGQDAFEQALQRVLEDCAVDLVVLAGFMTILSADFTRRWDHRILNVHPALIPSFCGRGFYGLRVHEAALARGVKVTGATVHYVNEIPDGGEILLQKAVEVLPEDSPETLQRRVMEQAEWILLPEAIELVSLRTETKKEAQE